MNTPRRGYSMLGIIISMAIMLVLATLLMNALNKRTTGQGSAVQGTVRSMEDQIKLQTIQRSMFIFAGDHRGVFPVPSLIAHSDDTSLDTTANLYSAMIALEYLTPEAVVAANEYSGFVEVYAPYDYLSYNPREGQYWDTGFQADLNDLSNASFAHTPLFGERYETYWRNDMHSTFPILGNRGPKDGIENPNSFTYGRNGVWGGHICFADGHIEFVNTFTPEQVYFERDNQRFQDNIFAVEDGPGGIDAILSFTKSMTKDGAVLQFD